MRSETREKCRGTLTFYTPAEPRRHPLPYEACGGVAIDRGSLLHRPRGGGHALFLGDLAGSAAAKGPVQGAEPLRRKAHASVGQAWHEAQ